MEFQVCALIAKFRHETDLDIAISVQSRAVKLRTTIDDARPEAEPVELEQDAGIDTADRGRDAQSGEATDLTSGRLGAVPVTLQPHKAATIEENAGHAHNIAQHDSGNIAPEHGTPRPDGFSATATEAEKQQRYVVGTSSPRVYTANTERPSFAALKNAVSILNKQAHQKRAR